MNLILIIIALAVGLIIWLAHIIKTAKANCLSEEKKERQTLEAEKKEEIRAEEGVIEQKEVRKQKAEVEERDLKTKVERDIREAELRQKIKDRKEHEAEEEKRKIEEDKEIK